jgi:hypothetical protein
MSRSVTRMSIHDAWHYSAAEREVIISSYPKHVRRARAMGLPAIGEGAVFPIDDDELWCDPFDIPSHWMEIGGLDFGWDHPTAAVRHVFDRESETFFVVDEYRERQRTPMQHVEALKGWGPHLPFAWGLEGLQTKLSENPEQTQKMFRKHGLKMLDAHATFDEGGVGVEAGVQQILDLMMVGKWRVFKTCRRWMEEKNGYHRAKGSDDKVAQIKKVHDDLMDASRYAYMMRRFAVPVSWRARYGGRPKLANKPFRRDSRDIFGGR